MNTEHIALLANLALSLSFIVGLIFGISQIKTAARDRKERLTLETFRNFQSREFSELIHHLIQNKIPPTLEEWRKMSANDQIMFIQFTQEMEFLGIMVAEKYIDVDLVDKTLGSFVITSWEKLRTVVLDMRKKQPDPFLCEYYQWLAGQLNERMRVMPRKPFHELN